MKLLIRSTTSFVLASFLLGCTPEIVLRSILSLVLLSIFIKCTQAYVSTPYPAEALPPATDHASSGRSDEVYQPKNDPEDFVAVIANPYSPSIPGTRYSYV
ncbi:MAG TPA: hypothetical protein VEC96_14110 [Anaerolineae bacterium]|nr:hypothetical protein [Anaerolineae bacterium]